MKRDPVPGFMQKLVTGFPFEGLKRRPETGMIRMVHDEPEGGDAQ